MTEEQTIVAALRQPVRRDILRFIVLMDEPLGSAEVARELGVVPISVRYHLRVLKDAGVLILVTERSPGGSTKHLYTHQRELTDLTWVREILGLPSVDGLGDRD